MLSAKLHAFSTAGSRPARPQVVRVARTCRSAVVRQHAAQQRVQQRQLLIVQAAASDAKSYEDPETAREAIDLGVQLCKQEKWSEALAIFEKGLNLPGTGQKRYRDKPRLISDSEKMAVLYNIACCHGKLGDVRSGLVALSGCLELGYQDFDVIKADPDMEALRQDPRMEGLLQRFQPKDAGLFGFDLGGLFGKK